MKHLHHLLTILAAAALSFATMGCGSFEEAGENVDEGVEEVGEEFEEAGDEIEEEVDEID